jgi:CheY-like chemotaxis protein
MIFMDLKMPKIDGFEATRVIRLSDTDTPIAALCVSVLKEDIKKAQQVGTNYHIAKPIGRREAPGTKLLASFLVTRIQNRM